jgi:hypothetical protein
VADVSGLLLGTGDAGPLGLLGIGDGDVVGVAGGELLGSSRLGAVSGSGLSDGTAWPVAGLFWAAGERPGLVLGEGEAPGRERGAMGICRGKGENWTWGLAMAEGWGLLDRWGCFWFDRVGGTLGVEKRRAARSRGKGLL